MNETTKKVAHGIHQLNMGIGIGRRESKALNSERKGVYKTACHIAHNLKVEFDDQQKFVVDFLEACGFY